MTTTAKKTNGKTAPKTNGTTATVADGKGEFTISALAKELRLDPRKCRAKLRASDLPHKAGEGWTFKSSQRDAVIAIIKAAD